MSIVFSDATGVINSFIEGEIMRYLILVTVVVSILMGGVPVEADGPIAVAPQRIPDGRIAIAGPTVIEHPGSYVLTRDVQSTLIGILITSSNVTLDLNGFTVSVGAGPPESQIFGIQVMDASHVEIKNGIINLTAGSPNTVGIVVGSDPYGDPTEGIVIRNVQIVGPFTQKGIVIDAVGGIIEGSTVRADFIGIEASGSALTIRDNVVVGETAIASGASSGCEIVRNTLFGRLWTNSTFVGNRISRNTLRASDTQYPLLYVEGDFNLIDGNQLTGGLLMFHIPSEGNLYRGNTALGNGAGLVDLGTDNVSHGDNYLPGPM